MSDEEDNPIDDLIQNPPLDDNFLNDEEWKEAIGEGLETPVEADRPTPAEFRGYRPKDMPTYIPFGARDPIISDDHIDRFPHNGGKSPPACISRLHSPLSPPAYVPPISPVSL